MPRAKGETRGERERKESEFFLPMDLHTQEILFRLSKRDDFVGKLANKIWEAMSAQVGEKENASSGALSVPAEITKKIDPRQWTALQYEIENERICYGEITPQVKEFEESRDQLNGSIRKLRERLQWESIKVSTELMGEEEKKESKLFEELNEVVQDLARELGFTRPVILEITRSRECNAFVLNVAREGGIDGGNAVPLRFFVHAGLIESAGKLLASDKKQLTRDHLAAVLGS